jgi:hypothetical protein
MFSRKSRSKYLTDTIDFNKHDIDIFINDAGDSSKLQSDLNFAFDQRESEVNFTTRHLRTNRPLT